MGGGCLPGGECAGDAEGELAVFRLLAQGVELAVLAGVAGDEDAVDGDAAFWAGLVAAAYGCDIPVVLDPRITGAVRGMVLTRPSAPAGSASRT